MNLPRIAGAHSSAALAGSTPLPPSQQPIAQSVGDQLVSAAAVPVSDAPPGTEATAQPSAHSTGAKAAASAADEPALQPTSQPAADESAAVKEGSAPAAEEAAREAEKAKHAPLVLECTDAVHHKSRLKYWVSDGAWEVLRRTAQLHLKHPEGAKCLGFEEGLIFKGASQFVLLSGPTHSELCQEACLR